MGVLGALVHRHDTVVAGVDVPWGLVLAVAPLVPLGLVAGRSVPLGGAALMIGWGLLLVLQGSLTPGQYLIGDDARGWTYTLLGLALLVAVVLANSKLGRSFPSDVVHRDALRHHRAVTEHRDASPPGGQT